MLDSVRLDIGKIEAIRSGLGFSKEQMAFLLNASRMTYHRWTSGMTVSKRKKRLVVDRLNQINIIRIELGGKVSFDDIIERMV